MKHYCTLTFLVPLLLHFFQCNSALLNCNLWRPICAKMMFSCMLSMSAPHVIKQFTRFSFEMNCKWICQNNFNHPCRFSQMSQRHLLSLWFLLFSCARCRLHFCCRPCFDFVLIIILNELFFWLLLYEIPINFSLQITRRKTHPDGIDGKNKQTMKSHQDNILNKTAKWEEEQQEDKSKAAFNCFVNIILGHTKLHIPTEENLFYCKTKVNNCAPV